MKAREKKYVGLWLDRRRAVIVTIAAEKQSVVQIESEIERKVRLSGGSRTGKTPYGPQQVSVDGRQEARLKRQLRQYYQQIMREIQTANKVLIFGPGEAKIELQRELQQSKAFAPQDISVASADKMTARQIAAKVRRFFAENAV